MSKRQWKIRRPQRVEQEAQELLWSAFTGRGSVAVLVGVCTSALIFVIVCLVSRWSGALSRFEACHDPFTLVPPEVCSALSVSSVLAFAAPLAILLLATFLLALSRSRKIFQSSAIETALLLLYAAVALRVLGLSGWLFGALLVLSFLSMYWGYRLSFARAFRR